MEARGGLFQNSQPVRSLTRVSALSNSLRKNIPSENQKGRPTGFSTSLDVVCAYAQYIIRSTPHEINPFVHPTRKNKNKKMRWGVSAIGDDVINLLCYPIFMQPAGIKLGNFPHVSRISGGVELTAHYNQVWRAFAIHKSSYQTGSQFPRGNLGSTSPAGESQRIPM